MEFSYNPHLSIGQNSLNHSEEFTVKFRVNYKTEYG